MGTQHVLISADIVYLNITRCVYLSLDRFSLMGRFIYIYISATVHPLSLPLNDSYNKEFVLKSYVYPYSFNYVKWLCYMLSKSSAFDHCNVATFTNFAELFLELQKRDGAPELLIS